MVNREGTRNSWQGNCNETITCHRIEKNSIERIEGGHHELIAATELNDRLDC